MRRVEKESLFREADVISIGLILSESTRGVVAGPELALMKTNTHLINISSRPTVDGAALIAVLRAGRIAGAGLDVYDVEWLPRSSVSVSALKAKFYLTIDIYH